MEQSTQAGPEQVDAHVMRSGARVGIDQDLASTSDEVAADAGDT